MFFSRWTFFQGIIVIALIILSFIADLFKQAIVTPMSSSTVIPMLIIMIFIILVISLNSLLMIFQTKKSNTFLLHPLWKKMNILMIIIIILSIIAFINAFLFSSLSELIQNNRWLFYLILYYFLFLTNVLVLSIVHKTIDRNISSEKKIELSFLWTVFVLFVIIFCFPSALWTLEVIAYGCLVDVSLHHV